MNSRVTVLDYGIGNVFSICNAFLQCGARIDLTGDCRKVRTADRLVLPGVGAFKDGMDNLRNAGLDEDIRAFTDTGRPLLGICLGMQMLMTVSEEFGICDGLDLISGRVAGIPAEGKNNVPHKIPHIGWNSIFPVTRDVNQWPSGVLENLEPRSMVYFVHSFHAVPMDRSHILAICDYNGVEVIAAVRKNNVFGCQFHPEKSGKTGLKIFKKFLEL